MYVLIAAGVIVAVVIIGATLLLRPDPQGGTAGESRQVGEEFVLIDYAYDGDEVTFLVVRNWPMSAPAAGRREDDRFHLMGLPPTYRDPDGRRRPISGTSHVYSLTGRN